MTTSTPLDDIQKYEIPSSICDNRWQNHSFNSERMQLGDQVAYQDKFLLKSSFCGDLLYENNYKISLTIFKI